VIVTLVRHHGPQGILARTWPTGSMVLWVAVILAGSLVLYYF
jgi:multicomponent Na+:H+ antiporter subunit D